MRWPRRTWLAVLLLAGNLVGPVATQVIAETAETPQGANAIDWSGTSPKAQLLDALIFAHAGYALLLVVVMRGWRVMALAVGLCAVLVAAVVNFFAYFAVTGVYW
jgi:hypothetical protein